MRPRSRYLLFALLVAFTGCDSVTGGGDETISIAEGATLQLTLGQSAPLTAKDGSGNTLTGTQVTWSSANTAVASVSSAGQVTAEGTGTTQVTARFGSAEAAIQVVVSFDAAQNQMLINVAGDFTASYVIDMGSGSTSDWVAAIGLQVEFLDRSDWNFGFLFGERWSATTSTGGGAIFALPDGLSAGTYTLPTTLEEALAEDLTALTTPFGVFYREDAQGRFFQYFPSGGALEITAVEVAGTDLAPLGSVQGTASFPADEYEELYNESTGEFEYDPTGRSVQVDIVFDIPAAVHRAGHMDLTATGGPYPTAVSLEGWASAWYNPSWGLEMEGWTVLNDGTSLWADLEIASPAEGTFQIGSGVGSYWSEYAGASYLEAPGESGSVVLTEFTAPSGSEYGVVRGSVDLTHRVDELSDRATGQAFTVTGTFAIPVAPESFAGAGEGGSSLANRVVPSPLTRLKRARGAAGPLEVGLPRR